MSIIKNLLGKTGGHPSYAEQLAAAYRQRMQWEAKLGGELFGPVPTGGYREFFCLDERTWIWHEAWQKDGQQRVVTTQYDVRPTGIYKTQTDSASQQNQASAYLIDDTEARNLYQSVHAYRAKVLAA